MPNMIILKDGYIIDERHFRETLLVIGEKELYWHFYPSEEGIWTTSINHQKTTIAEHKVREGGRQLTIIHTKHDYEISCILPNWEFSINASKLPDGFYNTFLVAWKEIRLAYLGYEFLFTFEVADKVNVDFPTPVCQANN
jgi:hypothetical protein